MPSKDQIQEWCEKIRSRYENYLLTSFYFKDVKLRTSFKRALKEYDLMKDDAFPESASSFLHGATSRSLADEYFQDKATALYPALQSDGDALYCHQEKAIRLAHGDNKNVVVATGTASGKTESFLYPILFELYRQHLDGELESPGVRALILYPMNALANDQRRRLGDICTYLHDEKSDFQPTFGQYIGETPKHKTDRWRNADERERERFPNELVFREEMRANPPHILLTNYSMLEYLLIRPEDSELFDGDRGRYWRFIVLDEAHQYRGVKGMEMGMLIRRLKRRVRDGGRGDKPFCCIATSATISSDENEESKSTVAEFAGELFGERGNFSSDNVVFSKRENRENFMQPQRYHLFMRALEGAFLIHQNGQDKVVLNREMVSETENAHSAAPLEIALCGECGQHYYVGRVGSDKVSKEAIRDPSHEEFGVDFYLPLNGELSIDKSWRSNGELLLCRRCGEISHGIPACECDASIPVKKCKVHDKYKDQMEKCGVCEYQRGAMGDPVQEIVHGSDGPNVVIATALHSLLPEDRRKILAFADSRQEAAFFAWYAEDTYGKLRDRNLIMRAFKVENDDEILSLSDLADCLRRVCEKSDLFLSGETKKTKDRKIHEMICREAVSDQKGISLEGVGLAKWFIAIPNEMQLPSAMFTKPWEFKEDEAEQLVSVLLDSLRSRLAVNFPGNPNWSNISIYARMSVCERNPKSRRNTFGWSNPQRSIISNFLTNLLPSSLKMEEKLNMAEDLMREVWCSIQDYDRRVAHEETKIFHRADSGGSFRLNLAWLRAKKLRPEDVIFECEICARLHFYNIRNACLRNKCPGRIFPVKVEDLAQNHYRSLYQDAEMPIVFRSEEHTAQLQSDEARERQTHFKDGRINLLSSSTTFEVGVDLGDLDAVFLRNVPPETFNYTQRAGRAGRRGDVPGIVLTYCRRNPHDLYHYAKPKERILGGKIHTPHLRLRNEKIISRHIVATALSEFFREHPARFKNVEQLVGGDWENPSCVTDFKRFCEKNRKPLGAILVTIVPEDMHKKTGLSDGSSWIKNAVGEESRFSIAEKDVCEDYRHMNKLEKDAAESGHYSRAEKAKSRIRTIAKEPALSFLSRHAIIPKYGFPVDVVNLDVRPSSEVEAAKVSLQRDLSQAIAEFAPGGKVVANKKEWESYGIKTIPGKNLPVKIYQRDRQRNFRQWREGDVAAPDDARKYLWPQFGFVTKMFKNPDEPKGRARRLYTTRPYFEGFIQEAHIDKRPLMFFGVEITQALPGRMVVLCEGRRGSGFYICRSCGASFSDRQSAHKTPIDTHCEGTLENLSFGHEFVTDVTRLHFDDVTEEWHAYSLAYAVLLGAASVLDVPDVDLNATITGRAKDGELSIVLYDNVPGGAGLVANLERKDIFHKTLLAAMDRVKGECGCDESCYGCLRSYRNQFAHPYLRREFALRFLESAVARA